MTPHRTEEATALRPSDLALLLLASGDTLPRQRARDQQADAAGLELKRRLLDRLVALDPEPDELDRTLLQLVEEFGQPTGPIRAIARMFAEEWQAAIVSAGWTDHLLNEAMHASTTEKKRGA
jgi:hypothetical protein